MLTATLVNALRKLMFMMLMAMMFVLMMDFSTNSDGYGVKNRILGELNYRHVVYGKILQVDSTREASLEKIVAIINRYNKRLKKTEKYGIANEIYEMSVKYDNLDVDLICATITHESARTWRPTVVSPAGALGLMQIMPYTGAFLSKHEGIPWTTPEEVLFSPINNIRMGCRYLSMLIELYHVDGGLAAYNGGERRAAEWLASGRNDEVLFEETRGYVPAVLKLYDTYRN